MIDLFVEQLNEKLMLHQRNFVSEVRRIDEMERRLEVIRCELLKDETQMKPLFRLMKTKLLLTQVPEKSLIWKLVSKKTKLKSKNYLRIIRN